MIAKYYSVEGLLWRSLSTVKGSGCSYESNHFFGAQIAMAPFASSAVTPFNSLVTLVICYFLVSSNNALKTSQILTENANLHQELSVVSVNHYSNLKLYKLYYKGR